MQSEMRIMMAGIVGLLLRGLLLRIVVMVRCAIDVETRILLTTLLLLRRVVSQLIIVVFFSYSLFFHLGRIGFGGRSSVCALRARVFYWHSINDVRTK